MGNSVRDEIKDAVRSTLKDLLEGYSLGEASSEDVVCEAVASISDAIFYILGVAPEEQDISLADYRFLSGRKAKDKGKTENGRELTAQEMSTEHIANSLALLKKKGFVAQSTLDFYLTCPLPVGGMAQMAFAEECSHVFACPVSSSIDMFEAELKQRGEDCAT